MIDCIVLSTGGAKGLVHLGFIQRYMEDGDMHLPNITTYVGASVGSAVSLLLSMGYTPTDIFKEICSMDSFFDASAFSRIGDIFTNYGLMDISSTNISKKLEELVCKKMGTIPTLKELKEKTNKNLHIAVTNVTHNKAEYLSAASHPDLSCTRAVEMSCNIPILFQRIFINGQYYVDGGAADSFPIVYAQSLPGVDKILGILLSGLPAYKDSNFLDYFYRIISVPMILLTDVRLKEVNEKHDIVIIQVDADTLLDSKMTVEEKMNLFIRGYTEAKYHKKGELLTVDLK